MKKLLAIFNIVVWLAILAIATPALAATMPSGGSVNINSIVYGPPPSTAPTINMPITGTTFSGNPITVSGTCTTGLQVRLFKNTIFAGSTLCSGSGDYTLQLDLSQGSNNLVARQYDGLDQPSPDSNLVTVYYNPPPTPAPSPALASTSPATAIQFVLNCDYSTFRAYADKPFSLPCQITGGAAPYAVSVDWGDGTTSVVVRNSQGNFVLEHAYKSAGNYVIKITGSDQNNVSAFLQMAIVVGGKQGILSQIAAPLYQCKPDILWPLVLLLLLALLILVTSYKLGKRKGEREELELLREQHRLRSEPIKTPTKRP